MCERASRCQRTPTPVGGVESIPYAASFSAPEAQRIREGLIPRVKEDRWFVYHAGGQILFHRSWTGQAVYRFEMRAVGDRFDVCNAVCATDVVAGSNPEHQARVLDFLVGTLLLGGRTPFPVSADVSQHLVSLHQHAVAGTGYREARAVGGSGGFRDGSVTSGTAPVEQTPRSAPKSGSSTPQRSAAYAVSVMVAALSAVAPFQPRRLPTAAEGAIVVVELVLACIATGLFAFLPFLLVVRIADIFRLRSAFFFVACGLVVAATGDVAIGVWMAARLPDGDPERLTFAEASARFLPGLLSGGGLGGLSYWALAGRHR